jgi:hypothetical protein
MAFVVKNVRDFADFGDETPPKRYSFIELERKL